MELIIRISRLVQVIIASLRVASCGIGTEFTFVRQVDAACAVLSRLARTPVAFDAVHNRSFAAKANLLPAHRRGVLTFPSSAVGSMAVLASGTSRAGVVARSKIAYVCVLIAGLSLLDFRHRCDLGKCNRPYACYWRVGN